jgi:hypothetical protein
MPESKKPRRPRRAPPLKVHVAYAPSSEGDEAWQLRILMGGH